MMIMMVIGDDSHDDYSGDDGGDYDGDYDDDYDEEGVVNIVVIDSGD
jgi:hypothetical protein